MTVEAVDSHARKRAIDELGKGMAPAVPGRFLSLDWMMLAERGLDQALSVGALRLAEDEHIYEAEADQRAKFSRLAWELARRANMTANEYGHPRATVILADGVEITAQGLTSSDAMGKLAEELDLCLGNGQIRQTRREDA